MQYFHSSSACRGSASSSSSHSVSSNGPSAHTSPPSRESRPSTPESRSLAILQRELNIPDLPPRTWDSMDILPPRSQAPKNTNTEFQQGVMMAARRMESVFPKARKAGEPVKPMEVIPGWNDGSQAWRQSTYNFAPPPKTRADVLDPRSKAYGTIIATPHRNSGGVVAEDPRMYDMEPSSPTWSTAPSNASSSSSSSSSSSNSALLSSFEDSFTRRSSSRMSVFSTSSSGSSPFPISSSLPTKTRPLSNLSAGGMLPVPDVLMKAPGRSSTSSSLSSLLEPSTGRSTRRHSSGSFAGYRMRSPLSLPSSSVTGSSSDDEELEGDEDAWKLPRRPQIETRSWSYDNQRTYPVMPMPPVKEVRIVNGVQVEVEVPRPLKKLFTFAEIPVNP
ncbi:unnamed protein product [Mycena citricolor]|uniref:Uncharacterized protein n=1 Tax=Mycena citricolor TaxID=2018698 RepID=A0AAD2HY85_9AGAR|nr:unnamed protein product [Mycena citricolor]